MHSGILFSYKEEKRHLLKIIILRDPEGQMLRVFIHMRNLHIILYPINSYIHDAKVDSISGRMEPES